MEPVSSQQIRAIGKWHRRAHQKTHQHYQVHLPTQGTGRPQERHHIMAVFMLGQTPKGRTQPNNPTNTVGGICLHARIHPCFHNSVDGVRPAKSVSWSNTFSYFMFLFITRKNYGVKRQGNLLTKILLLHVSTSVRQYVSTPVHQYVSTSVHHYVVWLQYVSTSVHQYASTLVHQYISTPCYLSNINPNTLLWHNGHETIVSKPYYRL